MINKLVSNPGKEFDTTCGIVGMENDSIIWKGNKHIFALHSSCMEYKWKEIKKEEE